MAAPQADEKLLRPTFPAGGIQLPDSAFAFLIINAATTVNRPAGDVRSLSFAVIAVYVDILCLFWCVYRMERRGGGEKPKAAVWVLAMELTALIPYVAAAVAPAEGPAMARGFKVNQLGRKLLLPEV